MTSSVHIFFITWRNSSALSPLLVNGILEASYSSLDQPRPRPDITLPCDKTSSVAYLLASIMSIMAVPNEILLVLAATYTKTSSGSNTVLYSTGRLPSEDAGYGV